MRTIFLTAFSTLLVLVVSSIVSAQTPDGETPAVEQACDKYEGEGARHGLCVAYCEAQDCDGIPPGVDQSCDRIRESFIDYSVKKGYKLGGGKKTIDCKAPACDADDKEFCGGRDLDCVIDGICQAICTSEFFGFDDMGNPLCSLQPICMKCVAKE